MAEKNRGGCKTSVFGKGNKKKKVVEASFRNDVRAKCTKSGIIT